MMQVPLVGLEPTRCKATVSKTAMSTNSIIKAFVHLERFELSMIGS